MSAQSLLRPFANRATLERVLPTLAIQSVVFVLMLLFARFVPQNLERGRERVREAESERDALQETMLLLIPLAAYSLLRRFYVENVKMTSTVFSKEISAFYLRQLEEMTDYSSELLKKNEKSTRQLMISVSNAALDTSILGLTLYDTDVRGLPYYLAWVYCLTRGTLALTRPLREGSPLVLPTQVPVTQARHHTFFSMPRIIESRYEKEQRALLTMGWVGIACLLKAPELFGFLTQLSRHVELMCANTAEVRVVTADIRDSLSFESF
ncbi:MAG: hypothetical protein P1U32_02850 [Legionellaceae bacterium]|nr:hypothetical protein [Legionellaceae bacterium]